MLLNDTLLHHALAKTTENCPEKVAVQTEENHYSYRQIDGMSDRLAAALQSKGVLRGDRIVICLGNRVETIVAFWGVLKAGCVVCNIGNDTSPANFRYILENSQATVLMTTADKFGDILADTPAPAPLKAVFLLDGTIESPRVHFMEATLSRDQQLICAPGTIDTDLAAIIYTSGSTGKPKGVMLTHRNMRAALASLNGYLNYNQSDNILCSLPLSFDYGLYQMIMSVSRGATLVLEKEFTWPVFLIKTIRRHRITVIPFVPTMLMLLHQYAQRRGVLFPDVRMVTNTGAALKPQHIEQMKALFPSARIFSMYGLTECKRCTYLPPEELDAKPGSVGVAIPNTELWLIDDEGSRIAEPHRVGQLVIRGSTVMAGYWRDPEATAKRLKPGPVAGEYVLHTGDLGSLDEDGYLYFRGRMDHVIKSRGIKVSPNELENFLYGISGVESAAVIGLEDEAAGGVLWAFLKCADDAKLGEQEVLERCLRGLEPHQVPHTIRIIDSFPRTPNGKFDMIQLRQISESGLRAGNAAAVAA
jgi:amino acid adenylation domain-containing protein